MGGAVSEFMEDVGSRSRGRKKRTAGGGRLISSSHAYLASKVTGINGLTEEF